MEKDATTLDVNNQEEQNENTEPTIDFDKFDNPKGKDEEKEVDELTRLKKELEAEQAARKKAEEERQRYKDSFDKKASEAAKRSREAREAAKAAEEPLQELEAYKAELEEFKLREKKTDLLYGLTEELGISKDMSETMVGAIYHEDTNELSIPDLVTSFRTVVEDVRKSSYEQGYETRDKEIASGKRRSLGNPKGETVAERKLREYEEKQRNRR